jgi:hypothetical protein
MTLEEGVRRGAVLLAEGNDDEHVLATLRAEGIADAIARRIVIFLPLAFGRRFLGGIGDGGGPRLSRTYAVHTSSHEHTLAEDPVYIEALAHAARADEESFRAIALRSSEVDAVNSALHSGSRIEDLVLSPPTLLEAFPEPERGGPADAATPFESNARVYLAPESALAREWIDAALEAHGAKASIGAADWSGITRPPTFFLQLDVRMHGAVLGERSVLESVGGVGDSVEAAIKNAFDKFCVGALHPLLACIVDEGLGGDQVEWVTREGSGEGGASARGRSSSNGSSPRASRSGRSSTRSSKRGCVRRRRARPTGYASS